MKEKFYSISIRGRVAYAILCLENAIKYYKKDNSNWTFLFNLLWSYTSEPVGKWHYHMAESTPRSILFDATYSQKEMEFLNEDDYNKLRELFCDSNIIINSIINKIFEIGTRDLYSSIINGSQDTLEYLQDVIDIMLQNEIPLPPIALFEKFSITENEGWGRDFTKNDILESI